MTDLTDLCRGEKPMQPVEPRRYVFGDQARAACAAMARLEAQFAELNEDEIDREVAGLVDHVVLRPRLLTFLLAGPCTPRRAARLVEALRSDHWSRAERARVADWLYPLAPDQATALLSPDQADFPPPQFRASPLAAHLLAQARAVWGARLPQALFADNTLSTQDERYASAVIRLGHAPSAGTALGLLQVAVERRYEGVTSALLAGDLLVSHAWTHVTLQAFFDLDWERHGQTKSSFARRSPPPPKLPIDLPSRRFEAIRCWARGEHPSAIKALEALFREAPTERGLSRELLTAMVAGNQRWSPLFQQAFDGLKELDPPAAEWFSQLQRTRTRGGVDAEQSLAMAATMALPLPTDPLFGLLVARLHRWLASSSAAEAAWSKLCERLGDLDPRFRAHIPALDREYMAALVLLRGSGPSELRVGAALRALLHLPPQAAWVQLALSLVTTEGRGAFLVDEDDEPTPLGSLLIDLCIRMVEALLKDQHPLSVRDEEGLTSGHPLVVSGTLLKVLNDLH